MGQILAVLLEAVFSFIIEIVVLLIDAAINGVRTVMFSRSTDSKDSLNQLQQQELD